MIFECFRSSVLPRVGQRTPEAVLALLSKAAMNVSLYGVHAYHRPHLRLGQAAEASATKFAVPASTQKPSEASACDANPNKEAEHKRQMQAQSQKQRINDEQFQLTWQRQFTL